jgi:hypothetical protein
VIASRAPAPSTRPTGARSYGFGPPVARLNLGLAPHRRLSSVSQEIVIATDQNCPSLRLGQEAARVQARRLLYAVTSSPRSPVHRMPEGCRDLVNRALISDPTPIALAPGNFTETNSTGSSVALSGGSVIIQMHDVAAHV